MTSKRGSSTACPGVSRKGNGARLKGEAAATEATAKTGHSTRNDRGNAITVDPGALAYPGVSRKGNGARLKCEAAATEATAKTGHSLGMTEGMR
jgi:hypothetical protein